MPSSKGYAALDTKSPLAPTAFSRREPGPTEIVIEILYCGVCHSDLHMARNEWGNAIYPMVPGHEIVGRVAAAGKSVKKFKVGDIAAVGVIIDSCRHCAPCKRGEEHFCAEGPTLTYAAKDRVDGSITMGGYSSNYVVDERFAHTVPANLDLAAVAPLLCAGITTYSPLRHWNVGPGKKVGIVGLGGLGHMGLKFAHSFGAHTVQLTTSLKKKDDAIKLGADEVVLSTDEAAMKKHAGTFDFILDTASAPHALEPYLSLLKQDGTITLVGLPEKPPSINMFCAHLQACLHRRVDDRRHARNAGDARLLWPQQHHCRGRSHPHPEDQRSLRTHVEAGCEIPVRHRHEFPQVGNLQHAA